MQYNNGDDAVSVSAKSSSDTLEAIANLSDEAAESFFKTAGKNSDELISAINKSSNIDEAVSFVSKYADDGAEIFLRHGDDAVTTVKNCQTTQEDALLSILMLRLKKEMLLVHMRKFMRLQKC